MRSPVKSLRSFHKGVLLLALAGLVAAGCSDKEKKAPPAPSNTAPEAPAEPPKPKDPPIDLKPKWEVGKRYVIREETVQEATTAMPNQPAPIKTGNSVNRSFALTVLSQRPEGGHIMEAEFLANKIEVRAGDRVTASFDSASDPKSDRTNALAKLNRNFAGGKFTYVTDAAGNVERVEGLTNLYQKLTLKLDRNSANMVRAQYSEPQLRHLGLLPEGLPPQPVSVGESWTNNFDTPISGASARFNVQSTLSAYEERNSRRVAVIKSSGTGQINLGNTPAAGALQFENVKLDGETLYDIETGRYTSMGVNMSFDLKVTANGQTMTQPVTIRTAKTLVEVFDAPKAADPAAPATAPAAAK